MIRARSADTALFSLGLAIRAALILAFTPVIHTKWFVPFLTFAGSAPRWPWTQFLQAGGDPQSFPYGLPYVAAFVPGVLTGNLLGAETGAHLGLGLTVLALEVVLLRLLQAIAEPGHRTRLLVTYWLSPLPIYVCYLHGQLDVLPIALLLGGYLALKRERYPASAGLLGLAAAAKFSMALPFPFVGLYLFGRPRLRQRGPLLGIIGLLVWAATWGPFLGGAGFRRMVLLTPETEKSFSLAIPIEGLEVYVLPLACLALLYWAWQVRRLDFNLMWAFSGAIFMAVLLLTPASPGWVMWAAPFLALHTARAGTLGQLLYWPFAIAFVLLHLLISNGASFAWSGQTPDLQLLLAPALQARLPSLLLTLTLASGGALAYQLVRRGIMLSAFQLATRRPFVMGVAGDSSTGKDSLVEAVAAIAGQDNITRVSGDDYHVWDRHKPMWQAMTHLNPKANDLEKFERHVARLTEGKPILARRYDHTSGRMSQPKLVRPAEVVAVSGLHALWPPGLRRSYDLSIFLDMDEDLRRFLKVRRDVGRRGHALENVMASIERRRDDADRYIRPQREHADLVFRLEARHPSAIADLDRDLNGAMLRLRVTFGPGRSFEEEARLLISLCGVQVVQRALEGGMTEMSVEGEATTDDIAAAARHLYPGMMEHLAEMPDWRPGLTGVMQLIILRELERTRRERGQAA